MTLEERAANADARPLPAPPGRRLTIKSVELVPIVVPLDREYRGSYYGMSQRATIVTRVITDEGVVGEAYAADEDKTLGEIYRVIREELAPRVIGMDGFAVERWWRRCASVTYDQLRDRRIGLVALASLDLAIWDAIGKALEMPLWRLWGGYRASVPVNIIGGYYGRDRGRLEDEVREWIDMGFHGCKFKVGGASPREDAARVATVRETAGDDFVITIDANQGYSKQDALELCGMVRDLGLRWFEEPCVWANDARDMRDVRNLGGIRTCAGQSEHSPQGCRHLMEVGAIDVCNFDASWSGGYTSWRRMAATAELYSVELGHHEEPHVAAHLLASQPHATYVEVFHPDRDPIWWQLIANRPKVTDGELALSDRSGLGWVLDEGYIARYRVDLG